MRSFKISLALFAAIATTAFAVPPVPATPASVDRVLYARPFVLEDGFANEWRKDGKTIESGYLLVLEVKRNLVYPRQTLEPVLFVGRQTAQRVNVGYESGRVVAIVPSPRKADGTLELDLTRALIWFGSPALPERVDAARVDLEHASAVESGVRPRPEAEMKTALARGGETVVLPGRDELTRHAARLIRRFVPGERELAENLLAERP